MRAPSWLLGLYSIQKATVAWAQTLHSDKNGDILIFFQNLVHECLFSNFSNLALSLIWFLKKVRLHILSLVTLIRKTGVWQGVQLSMESSVGPEIQHKSKLGRQAAPRQELSGKSTGKSFYVTRQV